MRLKINPMVLLLFWVFGIIPLQAQNTMQIPNVSGDAGDTVVVSVEIGNADPFTAFQLSLSLPSQATYLEGSAALTGRASDHTLSAGMVSGDSLRIIAYSSGSAAFAGNSGSVAAFSLVLKTVPGTYALAPKRVMIGNASSQNILTGVTDGQLTLVAPEISLGATTINYSRTIIGQYQDGSFSISNNGNSVLHIDSLIAAPLSAYTVRPGWSGTVSPSGSQSITMRFAPMSKGNITGTVKVYSDDPDEPVLTVNFTGLGYKVNELRTGSLSTRSGTDTTLSFRINNQEPFTGFQFDLILPSVLTFIPGSESLTSRKNGHSVSANTVTGNKVRVLAFSSDQTVFTGNDGDVVKLRFHVEGTGGTYGLNLAVAAITNEDGQNIISDTFNGQLNIAAGDIQSTASVNYGSISIFETANVNLTLQNTGNDTLRITGFTPDDPRFWADITLPLTINPAQQAVVPTYFHSGAPGSFSGRYRLRSNDPDEDPYDVAFSATAYSPNVVDVRNASAVLGGTVRIPVDVVNNDPFTAFQMDIVLPAPCACILDSCKLTGRAGADHVLFKLALGGNTYRFMAFSPSNALFSGTSGAVLNVYCIVSGSSGEYAVSVQNLVLSDINSSNTLSGSGGGMLELDDPAHTKIKIWLEGTYLAGGSMTTELKTAGSVPLTSPYTDARTVGSVPDGVTDWVSVELRTSATEVSAAQRSFFLKSDGNIVDDDGTTTDLQISGVAAGSYYLIVRHRNHLAVMSALAQTLTSTDPSLYDFSTGLGRYYGTDANRAKQVQTGVYGMTAGDTNATGTVDANDRSAAWNDRNKTGYESSDCNLSGTVDANDRSITWNNRNQTTSVP